MDTLAELATVGAVLAITVGGSLGVRSKMRSETGGAVLVVVSTAVGIVIAWIALSRLHDRREHARLDHAIDSAVRSDCDRPVPVAPNLAAMRELMCARDARYAELRAAGDVDVGVVAHGDLIGTALPRVPAGKAYVVAIVDRGGDVVASYPVDPTAPFSYLRDGHVPGAQSVRLYIDDKAVADAVLAR